MKEFWSIRFLRWFCPAHLLEEIEGDLLQKFERDKHTYNVQRAKRRLSWNVIRFFRPGIVLRNTWSLNITSMSLLSNYVKITYRNLNKRKAYAIINVLGLAVGMAACLVIGKYVEFEMSYERFHTNAKNIYRVVSSFYTDGNKESYSGYDLGPSLQHNMPEVKRIARMHGLSSVTSIINNGKEARFYEDNIQAVDSTFLKIFTFKYVHGDASALDAPNSVVLTEAVSVKYFGRVNPVGAELKLHDNWPGIYIVSAVIEDLPRNTHFKFDLLIPLHNVLHSEFYKNQNARWDNFHTYLELHERVDVALLEAKIPMFIKKYRGDDKAINGNSELQFQPLLNIHYSPDLQNPHSHRTQIYFFVLIAFFILIMAWINHINLATARAIERAREVGVKKALGVLRKQLIAQFILESIFVNLIGLVLSILLAWMSLPLLNAVTQQNLVFDFLQPELWVLTVGLFCFGSIASGFYPAFVLSSFKTTDVIKGKVSGVVSGWSLRSGLVVFQFVCSLLLIVGTVAIYQQVNHLQSQDKNMTTKQTIIVKGRA